MNDDRRLRVVLCWHMHQPQYREPVSGQYLAPWSYLHGIKDCTDMAAHLESQVGAAAVINFSPVLLDQIEDYCSQLQAYFAGTGKLRDPLLAALAQLDLTETGDSHLDLMRECLRLQGRRMLERFSHLHELVEIAKWTIAHPDASRYLDAHFTGDLLTWSHLAWLGESVRHADHRVTRLMHKATHYTSGDRRELLHLIHEQLRSIVPRYRALAAGARAELSASAYTHPILPLLMDFGSMHDTRPDLALPQAKYPGGTVCARAQLERARSAHTRRFGETPAGCWPPEGAVSEAALALLDESGFAWAASGQQVLLHSLGVAQATSDVLHRPYRLAGQRLAIFFRDDGLSDLIVSVYKNWRAGDAVADLLQRLESIADEPETEGGRVVSIVLDGETVWEHYPDNGYAFLNTLYATLAEHPRFCLTTFARCIADAGVPARPLTKLVAGSWVKGGLDAWIGHPHQNHAWEMLVAARLHYAAVAGRLNAEQRERVESQLAVCEGADWFRWPDAGDIAREAPQFDRLFRLQLASLYQLIGVAPPDGLAKPVNRENPHGNAGDAQRRAQTA